MYTWATLPDVTIAVVVMPDAEDKVTLACKCAWVNTVRKTLAHTIGTFVANETCSGKVHVPSGTYICTITW